MSATTSEKERPPTVLNSQGDNGGHVEIPTLTMTHLEKEIYDNVLTDPILAQKMELVNNAIDEIGMTPFHWKLFFLNGFGFAVESVSSKTPKYMLHAYTYTVASYCMFFNCESSRYERIRNPNSTNCWYSDGKPSWVSRWCCSMGYVSRYNWSTDSV